MENNTNTPKYLFKISQKDFLKAWKFTFQKKLKESYEDHINVSNEFGTEKLTFNGFSELMLMTASTYFETRDN